MVRALAIETSGRVGSVAIVLDGKVLREEQFSHGLKHAAGILPLIDRLCGELAWKPGNLDHLYISAGPGSFTGLRIGITLAKTLAFATGVKIVAVPTTRVLAENAPAEAAHVIVVLDAKRDQIFTARFERVDGVWAEREAARLDSLAAMLARAPRPVHLIGEGIPFHRQFIPANDSVIVTDEPLWRAQAWTVAAIGSAMADKQLFADPLQLTPIYIRLAEAEEKWQATHGAA